MLTVREGCEFDNRARRVWMDLANFAGPLAQFDLLFPWLSSLFTYKLS